MCTAASPHCGIVGAMKDGCLSVRAAKAAGLTWTRAPILIDWTVQCRDGSGSLPSSRLTHRSERYLGRQISHDHA
jgi:hypothetical protein